MASNAVIDLDGLRATVTKQAALVRQLKADGAAQTELAAAVATLTELRKTLDEASVSVDDGNKWKVDKAALENALTRRMFIVPSFEIHGGVAGLFDYGPPGCALKENIINYWKQHFVLEDNMLQIECTTLTPYPVLKTSGHVDKFEDLMVRDTKSGECFRADKLLEDFIENLIKTDKVMTTDKREELRKIAAQADAYEPSQLHEIFGKLGIKSPSTGNPLTEPFPFNLMFQTSIGPTGAAPGFLRPETAQGMFVNFRRLYEYNNHRLPMGVAQIGSAYRNEIAPRGGLIRVREFTMAEIEHFVHPDHKAHPKFATVAGLKLNLFPSENQVGDGKCISPTVGEAVATGVINNETLAYFMARTALFMYRIGVKPEGVRFRQHLRTEMAHYACDCWDAEILMAQGWVECVGHADRSAYDLEVHAKATKTDLVAREVYAEPRDERVVFLKANRGLMGKTFKLDNMTIAGALEAMCADETKAMAFHAELQANGSAALVIGDKSFTITKEMASFTVENRKVSERRFVPNVIEPSFGIGRILTGLLEHSFYVRNGDEQRAVLAFRPIVAPFKVVILPLDNRIDRSVVHSMAISLTQNALPNYVDESSASVGKRYSRADEIGVPFALTFDYQSMEDACVTLRERDSCAQVRLPIGDIVKIVKSLCDESLTWATLATMYTVVNTGGSGTEEDSTTAAVPGAKSAPAPLGGSGIGAGAGGGGGSSVAATSVKIVSGNSTGGSKGVVPEGKDRLYGRFNRPADIEAALKNGK